jgi:hypothetical protein
MDDAVAAVRAATEPHVQHCAAARNLSTVESYRWRVLTRDRVRRDALMTMRWSDESSRGLTCAFVVTQYPQTNGPSRGRLSAEGW